MEKSNLNIKELLEIIKKRILLIIIVTIVFSLIGYLITVYKIKPSYEARVKIFSGKPGNIQSTYSKEDIDNFSDFINTYIELIKTEDFMNDVIYDTKLDVTSDELISNIGFNTASGTPILEITYTSNNSESAKSVVEAISQKFSLRAKEIIVNTNIKVIDSVKVKEIVPNKMAIIVLSIISGILFGVILVIAIDYLDDTISGKKKLESILNIPVLAEVPIEGKYK